MGEPFTHLGEDTLSEGANLAVVAGGQVDQQIHNAFVRSFIITYLLLNPGFQIPKFSNSYTKH